MKPLYLGTLDSLILEVYIEQVLIYIFITESLTHTCMKMISNLKRILNKLKKIHLNKVEQVLIYIFIIESLTNACMKMIPNLKQI